MPNPAVDYVAIVLVAGIALLVGFLIGVGTASLLGLWEQKRESGQGNHKPPATISPGRNHESRPLPIEHDAPVPAQMKIAALSSRHGSTDIQAILEKKEKKGERRRGGVISPLLQVLRRKGVKESSTPTSLVGQIDAILQERLQTITSQPVNIHLVDKHDGGLVVVIGDHEYDRIDQIPDEQVRALIQECVSVWEKRQDESIRRY